MNTDQPSPPNENPHPAPDQLVHVRVIGRVQGVGFRYFVLERAQALNLGGWVRNRWDDSVEIMAQGPREALDRFLVMVERGPRSAFVSRMETEWLDPRSQAGGAPFQDFLIRRTE